MNLQHRNPRLTRALLGAVLSGMWLGASAASFDCAKARSKSERLICGDPKLSALDDQLAALASAGKKRADSPRAYQRALDAAWSVRQKCEDIACVEGWYARRIDALSNEETKPDGPAQASPVKEQPAARSIGERPVVPAKAPVPAPRGDALPATPAPAAPAIRVEAPRPPIPAARPEPKAEPKVETKAEIKAETKVETPVATTAPAPAKRAPEPSPNISSTPRAPAMAPFKGPPEPNVSPGAQLLVIGEELGFNIPLTRQEFLDRFNATGAECGVSQHLPSHKALSPSAQSDCWTGRECPAPSAGLSCKVLRTAYDGSGRIVLFTTTLNGHDANGARDMSKVLKKFAEFGSSEVSTREGADGRVLSSTGSLGLFRLDAVVTGAEGGKQGGVFTIATK